MTDFAVSGTVAVHRHEVEEGPPFEAVTVTGGQIHIAGVVDGAALIINVTEVAPNFVITLNDSRTSAGTAQATITVKRYSERNGIGRHHQVFRRSTSTTGADVSAFGAELVIPMDEVTSLEISAVGSYTTIIA